MRSLISRLTATTALGIAMVGMGLTLVAAGGYTFGGEMDPHGGGLSLPHAVTGSLAVGQNHAGVAGPAIMDKCPGCPYLG